MQIISQFAPLPLAQPEKGTAVAMGFFDGIHIGHRAVIESAVQCTCAGCPGDRCSGSCS